VLVDVGPADSYEALRYLRREGLFVDAVILSHLDEDHAGALGVLLGSEVEIPSVFIPRSAGYEDLSPAVTAAFDLLRIQSIPVNEVCKGDRI
jgi:beta-lactamase superfamily II metal-dependent hydrolase